MKLTGKQDNHAAIRPILTADHIERGLELAKDPSR